MYNDTQSREVLTEKQIFNETGLTSLAEVKQEKYTMKVFKVWPLLK